MRAPVLVPAICCVLALAAQPSLQYDNLGLPGSAYDLYGIIEPGSSDFGLEGEATDWDFTSSIIDLVGAAIFTLPQNTPFGADYPDADVALLVINYANFDSAYDYFDVQPTGISRLASSIDGAYPEVYSDPSTFLVFPLAYGGQYQDDYTVNGTPYSIARTCTGWGTLETAASLTDNVLKVTSSNGEMAWYRSDPVEPILTISASNTRIIWERITIGMREHDASLPLTLAPNPASANFRIPGLQASAMYRVIDATGRMVMAGRISGAQETIDVQALRPGLYRVVVQEARKMRAATLVKE